MKIQANPGYSTTRFAFSGQGTTSNRGATVFTHNRKQYTPNNPNDVAAIEAARRDFQAARASGDPKSIEKATLRFNETAARIARALQPKA